MAALDVTAATAVLKQKYEKRVEMLCYKNNPYFALVPKFEDFGGYNKVIAMRVASPQSRSAGFSNVVSAPIASVYKGFNLTRVRDYAVASITGEAIEASKGNDNALLDALENEIDGAVFTCMRNLAFAMYRNGGGARGQISAGSNVGTATITLATVQDVTNFEVGMLLQASSTDGTSGTTRSSGATVTLSGIDRDLGTLTATGNWSAGIALVAASDYLFQKGDHQADATYGGVGLIAGALAWIPTTAPTSTLFFGVDRTADVTRLGGIRFNGSGGPIEETLIEAAGRACREGSMPDYAFLNPLDYTNLVKALGSKVVYDRASAPGVKDPAVGFTAVKLVGPNSDIKVIPDLNCPKGQAFLVQMDTWGLHTAGKAPRILDFDGQTILRNYQADQYDIRVGYYGNMGCRAPGWNVNITL